MKYSILVPVYNVEKYLPQCLDSLVNQTYRDFEVILTDDGSTDGSAKICDRYAEAHPELFRVFHKKNEGLLMTRRFSLQRARGDYILFVDSDDYVSLELLWAVNEVFEEYACDMVLFNFFRFTDGKDDYIAPNIPFAHGTVFEEEQKPALLRAFLLQGTFCNMWVKAVRRDFVDIDANYTERNVAKCEDVVQSMPLFHRCGRIAYSDEKLYYYRKNAGSMTLNYKSQDFQDYVTAILEARKYMEMWHFSEREQKEFYTRKLYFFYELLRNVNADNQGEYALLVQKMLHDEVLRDSFNRTELSMLPRHIRFRVMLFRCSFLGKCLWGINAVICGSNVAKGVKSFVRKHIKA